MDKAPHTWEGLHVLKAHRGYAPTPMGQVHYAIVGDGAPIVLLHQSPWFAVQYATAQPVLARGGLMTIAIDTPGFGRSDLPDHPPTVEEYADNILPVLDHLKIDKAIVLGHHTGASIAAAFAARHPARTSAVIMHGPPLYTAEERADRIKNQLHPDISLHADGAHFTARWERIRSRGGATADASSMTWSTLSFFLAGSQEWYGHSAVFHFDMAAALHAVAAPTLVMSNTADTIHHTAARALALRPDFAYHELPGGSSHMMYDDPAPWAAGVLQFLATICSGLS